MTTSSGSLSVCADLTFGLSFTCEGPNCSLLSGIPNLTCNSPDDTDVSCTNGVTCPTPSNYTVAFSMAEPLTIIQHNITITLPDQCVEIDIVSSGGISGLSVVANQLTGCTIPGGGSNPILSASTSYSASSSSSVGGAGTTTWSSWGGGQTGPPGDQGGPGVQATGTYNGGNHPVSIQHSNFAPAMKPILGLGAMMQFLAMGPANAEHLVPKVRAVKRSDSSKLERRQPSEALKDFTDLFGEYLAGKLSDPNLEPTIVGEIANAVCSHYVNEGLTEVLIPEVTEVIELMEEDFLALAIPAGPVGWLAYLFFVIELNAYISALFPQLDQAVKAACAVTKPWGNGQMPNFGTDPNNCGGVGIVCPSGQCVNSACSTSSCTGETCATFTNCGPGGECVCGSTAEGTGVCVDGSTPCDGLPTCNTSADCPGGQTCFVQSCCEVNVCASAASCSSGGNDPASKLKYLMARAANGPTFGRM